MLRPVVLDALNMFEPEFFKELGFMYQGVGRGA